MQEAIAGFITVVVLVSILLSPFVGAYVAIKHGDQIRRNAKKRRIQASILTGLSDGNATNDAIEDLRQRGII